MKVALDSKKHRYVVGAGIFLITAALVWAMIGCTQYLPEYKLTISSTAGGNVTEPGEGTLFLTKGASVLLKVHPDDGYWFVGWTGDVGKIHDAKSTQTIIDIRGEYSITAEFEKIRECRLTVAATVGGGRITAPGEGVFTYDSGDEIDLEAHENRGFGFVNWTGDVGTVVDVNAATTEIIMEGNYSIEANFEAEGAVNITDPNLKAAIIAATGITEGDIYPSDLKRLPSLDAGQRDVFDLTGLEYCTGLKKLYLDGNQIDDISHVANLTSLKELYLSRNQISDISLLANLTSLTHLYLSGNQISDISALTSLTRLSDLSLGGNQIYDISPLANLFNLTLLNLSNNQISDIQPLVDNQGLSRGDKVYLYNALSYSPLSYGYVSANISQLQVRGVIVEY